MRQSGGEVVDWALMDYVLISSKDKERLIDVNVLRGIHAGMSDHFLVEGKLKVKYRWERRKVGGGGREMIKFSELAKEEKVREYQGKLEEKWEGVRGSEWRGVEEEWECFKETVYKSAVEVCGMRRVGRQGIKKGSEWWNEEVKKVVAEKRQVYERWLQSKRREDWELYKVKRREVKRSVKQAKRVANERWGERLARDFKSCKKMFWKEVNRVRKGESKKEECVKDVNGEVLTEREQVLGRWGEYFGNLLNVTDERKAEIAVVGGGRMPRGERSMNEVIGRGEVKAAIKRLKAGKSAGLDGIVGECIKSGGETVVEWLVRVFNGCFESGCVPRDWKSACIVPLYKGKGDKRDCGSYRGISLLSVVGKLYGRVLIERVIECTDGAIGGEQCGFRKGMSCGDQIFAVRQICEKKLEKHQEVFWAFMDLEKAYDRIDREAL